MFINDTLANVDHITKMLQEQQERKEQRSYQGDRIIKMLLVYFFDLSLPICYMIVSLKKQTNKQTWKCKTENCKQLTKK